MSAIIILFLFFKWPFSSHAPKGNLNKHYPKPWLKKKSLDLTHYALECFLYNVIDSSMPGQAYCKSI